MDKIFYTGTTKPMHDKRIVHCPTIHTVFIEPENKQNIESILPEKPKIVFFSQNGVDGFQRFFTLPAVPIFAVGQKTANSIYRLWQQKAIQPVENNAQGMCQLFSMMMPTPVIVVRNPEGRMEFVNWLEQHKWPFITALVYQTEIRGNSLIAEHFTNTVDEKIIFTSPSTVYGFLKSISQNNFSHIQAKLISIGKTTSQTIKDLGGSVHFEARLPDSKILLQQVMETNF